MREVSLMKQPLETDADRLLAMLFSNCILNVPQRFTQPGSITLSRKQLVLIYRFCKCTHTDVVRHISM